MNDVELATAMNATADGISELHKQLEQAEQVENDELFTAIADQIQEAADQLEGLLQQGNVLQAIDHFSQGTREFLAGYLDGEVDFEHIAQAL